MDWVTGGRKEVGRNRAVSVSRIRDWTSPPAPGVDKPENTNVYFFF
jgi:hypothetical protein